MPNCAIHWFREDLRLADNPALLEAAEHGPVLCLYILDEGPRKRLGGASRWWLAGSLRALGGAIASKGGELALMRGDPAELIPLVTEELGADLVTWSRRYDAPGIDLDKDLKATLTDKGTTVRSLNAALLNEPWEVESKAGKPLKIYSPYWRAVKAKGEPPAPLKAPRRIEKPRIPASLREQFVSLDDLELEPTKPDWAGGLRETWQPGEQAARSRLQEFLGERLSGYGDGRNRPDREATSRLSPHLRFGEIGPRQIWHATREASSRGRSNGRQADADKFLSELGWREFSYSLLFHHPDLDRVNFTRRYDAFPWRKDATSFRAWTKGETGYPIVDAGMRQLWQTGWMHNRVRMITASFLIKHLLIDWREGEDWFWDTLVDADPANNAASWQWVAGSGADAAPYFRIFNPVLQGQKFDPAGDYVRRYVPELAKLPKSAIHVPWEQDDTVLAKASVKLGTDYPRPIVDLGKGRARALEALATLKPA